MSTSRDSLAFIDRIRRNACEFRTDVDGFFNSLRWSRPGDSGSGGSGGDAVSVQTGDRRVPVAEVQLAWPGEAPRGAIERVVLRLAAFPGFGIRELENLFGPMIEGLKYDWDEPASWYAHIDDPARNEFAAVVVQYGTGPTASVPQMITITPYDRDEVTS